MFTLKNILILIGRNALISLAVIFISLIGIFYLSKEINKISNTAVQKNLQSSNLKRATNISETYNNDKQIVGENYTNIENAFLPSDNISKFTNALDDLTSKNGVKQVYNFETPTPISLLGPFPVSTIAYTNSFTTNISSFSNYLKDFEKLNYFTKIDGFTISSQGKTGWLETSTVSLKAILYAKTIQ